MDVKKIDFTGKSMKGFLYIKPEILNTNKKLKYWLDLALDYNDIAKATKKKK